MAGLMTAAGALFKGIGLAQGLQIGGTLLSTAGAISAGKAQNAASKFTARQLDAKAKAQQAASQRDAEREMKRGQLMMSRARAVGAASGGGQDYDLLDDIAEETYYNSLMAQWEGGDAAAGTRLQAAASRMEGSSALKTGYLRGASTVASAAPLLKDSFDTLTGNGRSFRDKYWG